MTRTIGAMRAKDGNCHFTVWAPEKEIMQLHLLAPEERTIDMQKDKDGYFTASVPGLQAGTGYYYIPAGGKDAADPASFYQPEGVHGPSEVADLDYPWTDSNWRNLPMKDYIIYELHVGTFTEDGTFESAISRLDDLADTGITAIEIMPVAQFPGERNWGYDGVFPYAAQHSYGGYRGLQKLVDACHNKGIAVILDVVYNHLGPEGNCLPQYAPYFTDKYKTPWGDAINYDGEWSDGVRNYFCNNALYWFRNFHIDALRLDAIHQMYDFGALHFWEYLSEEVHMLAQETGRYLYLIAESDLNNPKIVKTPEAGGYGFNAQWLDDFHHALYVKLDPDGKHRYADFGATEQIAKAFTDGFVHSGEYVTFRKKKFGMPSTGLPGDHFIVFNQNHDQVGNRVDGKRLTSLTTPALLKVAAAAIMLSPYIPMLFMGEEYGEDAPFHYFIDHTDPELVKAVQEGRKQEFAHEKWEGVTIDPASPATFEDSKLNWQKRSNEQNAQLHDWMKMLIRLRKENAALRNFNKNDVRINIVEEGCFTLHRTCETGNEQLMAIFNLSGKPVQLHHAVPDSSWTKLCGTTAGMPKDNTRHVIAAEDVAIYIKS